MNNQITDPVVIDYARKLQAYLEQQNTPVEELGHTFVSGISENKIIQEIDYSIWHSVNGRVLGKAILLSNTMIAGSLTFLLGFRLNSFISYWIVYFNLQAQGEVMALGIIYVVTLLFILTSAMTNSFILRKMQGSDGIEYETRYDKALVQMNQNIQKLHEQNNQMLAHLKTT
jgi:hypothetical protein